MKTTVWYSCDGCNLDRRPVEITARGGKEEILPFMDRVKNAISFDHSMISPQCKKVTADIFLRVGDDAETIGGSVASPTLPPDRHLFKPVEEGQE